MFVDDENHQGHTNIETYSDPYAYLTISLNYEQFMKEHGDSNTLLSFNY